MRVLILVVVGCLSASADTIELKTGERIEGTFKQAGAAGAVIEIGGQPVTFALDKVRAIYLGAVVAAAPVSASTEALTALKGLRSVTASGINYRDYSTRVLDAKVIVDRYVGEAGADPQAAIIAKAMQYFELASQAWGLRISGFTGGLGRLVEVGQAVAGNLTDCPSLRAAIEQGDQFRAKMKIKPPKTDAEKLMNIGSDMGEPAPLWKCGSERVGDAERLKP